MKAITICQPFAHLICLPDDDPRAKRVENRKWPTSYRGPLLIHAGKSRAWLSRDEYGIPVGDMTFGAIVGICDVVGCIELDSPESVSNANRKWPWLATHDHVEGPFCFVLENCRRLREPVPYRGFYGLFDIDYATKGKVAHVLPFREPTPT